MHEWSESQLMIRDAVRQFVENEIAPNVEELEHGDMPPYDLLRKMYQTFGMDEMAGARFDKTIAAEKKGKKIEKKSGGDPAARADQAAATLIPIIELCRYCPGIQCSLCARGERGRPAPPASWGRQRSVRRRPCC